ncbi:glycogen/starch synthase [Kitasatospora sp. NPDC059973]|uniref:glycogen/starch synthase n=1 Tax=Kitasatospora sp. NPDC059973 TaxID=3347020 RepID=UPI0036B59012
MHIVKFAFESVGFDIRLMRGGLASLVWNLAREFADQGHRVSVITPAHGCLEHLRAHYELEELDHVDRHTVPLVLDRAVWPGHPAELELRLTTRAHRLRHEGVDIYFLSDEYLDLLPERIYPARTSEGHDLAFFKPLVFQVSGLRFLRAHLDLGAEPAVVQAYEPYYHYLLPPVLRTDPRFLVVSTLASNMPINQQVHRPQLERLLELFDTDADLDALADPPATGGLAAAMTSQLPSTHLADRPTADGIGYYALVAANCDLLDFLTPGQLDFYSTFRDTPFERAFQDLTVARIVRESAARQFVGGCAVPDGWLARDPAGADRARLLTARGLDPALPTFYHVARFSVHHKGQVELFRAIDAVLAVDPDVNFVVRCAVAAGGDGVVSPVGDPFFEEVANRHPGRVRLDWSMAGEDVLHREAVAADFCLFPSKFELDSFLIAQGQLMACGAVPIGTAQEVTTHYRHQLPREHPDATGFAVPRSFTEDDPLLAAALADRILEAARIHREDPAEYRRLSDNSRALARRFTWRKAATTRLATFAAAAAGVLPGLTPERAAGYGWFESLADTDWVTHRREIAESALDRGDLANYRRCVPAVDRTALEQLFAAAYARADFARCAELAVLLDDPGRTALVDGRCLVEPVADGLRIDYRLPHAESVLLVLPTGEHRLAGAEGYFTTVLRERPPGPLVLLLRLRDGRSAWDECPLETPRRVTPVGAGLERD